MKKLFAMLLALALLIPMGAVMPVSAASVEVEPFYFVNWDDDIIDFDNIYKMPKFNCSTINENTTSAPMNCTFDGRPANTITSLAKGLKAQFDEYPEGTRYINFALFIEALAEKCVYLDKGTDLFNKWIDEFFAEYKRIGGKIDGLVVDVEYNYCHAHYVNLAANDKTNEHYMPDLFNEIVNDPRYATEIRPLLEERGYIFEGDPEISTMRSNSTNYSIWGAVATNRLCAYINEAVAPLYKYYPDALVSNYCYPSSKAWNSNVANNGNVGNGGNTDYAGNTANQNFYLRRPHDDYYVSGGTYKYVKPPAYNNAVYDMSKFHAFMFETMMFKNMYDSADCKRISAWIAGYNYKTAGNSNSTDYIGETPYYTEVLFHIGLLNPQPFIGYTLQRDVGDEHYDDAMQIISESLEELTKLVGAADREPISIFNDWNSDYVLSGMYAGGRNVWRITPNTDEVSLSQFKVKDKAPTFSVNGQTVIFPQGRIIETSDIHMIGSCGYWIETPANVQPVIINDTDRFSKYPSYMENFESYSAGTTFNSTAAKDKQTWTVDGSALKVQTNVGDKALAMTGTSTLTQKTLPGKITAGDSYAKQQIWEVAVTVSSGGVLKVLSCGETDGGVKIDGGKVYYDKAGSYQQLSGVSVSAGSTYTIRREVDFRTAGSYKSSYSVYDSTGKRLGGVDNVAMSSVDVPVKTISFSGTSLSGTAYLDDYKLYPTGITTELKVYDAKTGIQESNPNVTRNKDTGYRVSWMNASGEDKVVKLYNNGSLVAQAHMAPGASGVFNGVVKGNSVKLTVNVENAAAINHPNYDAGDFGWKAYETGSTTGGNTGDTTGGNTGGNTGGSTGGNTGGNNGGNTGSNVDTTVPSGTVDATIPGVTGDATTPATGDATNPADDDTTQPGDTEPGKQSGLTGGQIALIVIASVLVVAGGAFALCWFVIKPQWLMSFDWAAFFNGLKQKIAKLFNRR